MSGHLRGRMFKWDPEPGQLFIREIISSDGDIVESHLGCIVRPRVHPSAGLHYVVLVEMTFDTTSPTGSGCTCIDFSHGKEEMISETRKVYRRLASGQDIHNLLKLWDKKERVRPDEWVARVRNRVMVQDKLLSQSEFDRLNEIAKEYATRHPLNRYNSE